MQSRIKWVLAAMMFFIMVPLTNSAFAADPGKEQSVDFFSKPLYTEPETVARELVAYAIRPTENFQLYVYHQDDQAEMAKSVAWVNYHVNFDSTEAMQKGLAALVSLMEKNGVTKWRPGLYYFQQVMLDGFAMDLLMRSGRIQEQAAPILRKVRGSDVWYPNTAFHYWVEVRDFIRTSAGLKPGYDQDTREVATAVKISE